MLRRDSFKRQPLPGSSCPPPSLRGLDKCPALRTPHDTPALPLQQLFHTSKYNCLTISHVPHLQPAFGANPEKIELKLGGYQTEFMKDAGGRILELQTLQDKYVDGEQVNGGGSGGRACVVCVCACVRGGRRASVPVVCSELEPLEEESVDGKQVSGACANLYRHMPMWVRTGR